MYSNNISHLVIVVLLSFLFFHGCSSARCFGLINNQHPAKRLHLLSKEMMMTEEKLKHDRVSTPSVWEEKSSEEVIRDKKHELKRARKEVEHHHHHHEKNKMNKDGGVSGVTWKVREKKKGEPQEEFNLDYLPARTHPPVHN